MPRGRGALSSPSPCSPASLNLAVSFCFHCTCGLTRLLFLGVLICLFYSSRLRVSQTRTRVGTELQTRGEGIDRRIHRWDVKPFTNHTIRESSGKKREDSVAARQTQVQHQITTH